MRITMKVLFLLIGTITILEYLLVRGMFTWLIVATASVVMGAINVVWEIKDRNYLESLLYVLATVALLMGYFPFL